MDMNEYALEVLARDRLAEMRARAAQSSRVRAASPAARSLRAVLGHAIIRLGCRVQGVRGYPRVTMDAGDAIKTRRPSPRGAVHG